MIFLSLETVLANEEEYTFNGFSWDFSPIQGDNTEYPKLKIDIDHPDDVPHRFKPFPEYNPGLYDTWEKLELASTNRSGTMSWDTYEIIFPLTPLPGIYRLQVIENYSKVLYTHNFTMNYDISIKIDSIKWILDAVTLSRSYATSVDENKQNSIGGIQISFSLENTGDIPISLGNPNAIDMNLLYKVRLYNKELNETIYLSNAESFQHKTGSDKFYLNTNEFLNITTDIINNSIFLAEFNAGTYSLDGEILFNNYSYSFEATEVVLVSENKDTPGFEIFIVIIAVVLSLIFINNKRKR